MLQGCVTVILENLKQNGFKHSGQYANHELCVCYKVSCLPRFDQNRQNNHDEDKVQAELFEYCLCPITPLCGCSGPYI